VAPPAPSNAEPQSKPPSSERVTVGAQVDRIGNSSIGFADAAGAAMAPAIKPAASM
jgi:hypothetical protein